MIDGPTPGGCAGGAFSTAGGGAAAGTSGAFTGGRGGALTGDSGASACICGVGFTSAGAGVPANFPAGISNNSCT